MERNRQRKRNRNASDIEVDRELGAQPEPRQAQKNKKDSGEARRDRHDNNTWHAKKAKLHTVMRGVCAAGLEAGAVVASEVVEVRVVTQLEAWVEACSMRALLGSLLLGLAVRGWFTRLRGLPDGQEVFEEIPAEDAFIPNLADRNMYLQLVRGLPPPSRSSQPSAVVEDVLALYPGLHARLNAVPRYQHDSNTVDDVGTKLETNFANSLTELFPRRVEQAVALAGARVIAGSHEHQRRLWLPVDGSPAWTERQRSWVARRVQGKVVTWLEGAGGVVPTAAMRDELARQRRLLGLGQGVVVNDAWLERGVNRGNLLRHAVDISRQLEAANVSWQLDWAVWQAAGGQPNTRPYRPPSPFALTPSCSCKAHHIKLDTQAIYGLMRTAGMLPADITSEEKFRSGVVRRGRKLEPGPKDSETVKGAKVRCNSAATGRPLALAYGAAGFSGSGSIGSKGVPVKQMQREACKQFPGRVVLVHEFRTSRVSSARTNVVQGQAESFRWLHPVRSMATRSRIRGLMCSTSIGIRFYDRDVSAALNIARIAAGPGRPRELSSWLGRPAMPNPGRPGQEWVCVRDKGLLRKWQRRHQRQR